MPLITCLACGAARDLAPGQMLPPSAHAADCPILRGMQWACSCYGPYCDGRFVGPKEADDILSCHSGPAPFRGPQGPHY
jgi:hypothetical protein